jgi:hypothetical protein
VSLWKREPSCPLKSVELLVGDAKCPDGVARGLDGRGGREVCGLRLLLLFGGDSVRFPKFPNPQQLAVTGFKIRLRGEKRGFRLNDGGVLFEADAADGFEFDREFARSGRFDLDGLQLSWR